jgi:hypothetical protein
MQDVFEKGPRDRNSYVFLYLEPKWLQWPEGQVNEIHLLFAL